MDDKCKRMSVRVGKREAERDRKGEIPRNTSEIIRFSTNQTTTTTYFIIYEL